MSEKKIIKEVQAMICDYCQKEIVKTEGYCYDNLIKTNDDIPFNEKKLGVTHYLFFWQKKAYPRAEYIRYDFHPECLDAVIRAGMKGNKNEK